MGFLFFMFPLPVTWTGAAAVWLQDTVSRVSAPVLNLFWICHRRGNELVIAGLEDNLLVAPECSGLRQLVAFLALAALIAYLGKKPLLRGCVLHHSLGDGEGEGEAPAVPFGDRTFTPPTVPLSELMPLTRIPIIIYYGDNIPEQRSANPGQEQWRVFLQVARFDPSEEQGGNAAAQKR